MSGDEFDERWDDDWYDDMPVYDKEEPDCGACNDSGVTYRGRRCRSCRPTRVDIWRWRLGEPYWRWRRRRQALHSPYSDEAPF